SATRSSSCPFLLLSPEALINVGQLCRQTSIYPRQDLLQVCKELLPPVLGALVGLLLIRPEARLLHAQVGPRARRGESPSSDSLETIGRPRVRQRFVRLDCQDLTVDRPPGRAKIERVGHDRLEIVFHQPLLDQVWLGESAPDLFRRISYLTFDNDGARFGRCFVHWSILLSRSSRLSNRLCQNPVSQAGTWIFVDVSDSAEASESFPLDRAGRLARHVVDDAVDALDLVDDAGGHVPDELHVEGVKGRGQ